MSIGASANALPLQQEDSIPSSLLRQFESYSLDAPAGALAHERDIPVLVDGAQAMPHLAPDMAGRQKATRDFFSEGFTNAGRWEIIAEYHVTHILYREFWAEPWMRETFRGFGEEIDINGDLKLIVIDFARKPSAQTGERDNRS